MKKKVAALFLCTVLGASVMGGCGNSKDSGTTDTGTKAEAEAPSDTSQPAPAETEGEDMSDTNLAAGNISGEAGAAGAESAEQFEATEIQLFAAASLQNVMEELIGMYNQKQPNVTVTGSYDSSGTLLEQIENGFECDVFFSAAQKQMDTLENDDSLVVEGTRSNVVNNQVCVVALKDSNTAVTGLDNIKEAASFALADGSVPVGKYTRQALVADGQLTEAEDVSTITTQEVSEQLGVEISEQGNVSKVLMAVAEGSCEVGTVYYSDYIGYEKKEALDVIEKIPYDLTGNVIYPIGQIVNTEADDLQSAAAADFIQFILSDEAKAVFEEYGFDTNIQ